MRISSGLRARFGCVDGASPGVSVSSAAFADSGTHQHQDRQSRFRDRRFGGQRRSHVSRQRYPLSIGGLSYGFTFGASETNFHGRVDNIRPSVRRRGRLRPGRRRRRHRPRRAGCGLGQPERCHLDTVRPPGRRHRQRRSQRAGAVVAPLSRTPPCNEMAGSNPGQFFFGVASGASRRQDMRQDMRHRPYSLCGPGEAVVPCLAFSPPSSNGGRAERRGPQQPRSLCVIGELDSQRVSHHEVAGSPGAPRAVFLRFCSALVSVVDPFVRLRQLQTPRRPHRQAPATRPHALTGMLSAYRAVRGP